MAKPLDLAQFTGEILLDGSLGAFTAGGTADPGIYTVRVTDIGIMLREGKSPSLAVTLEGVGDRPVYEYVTLPTDPNAEHYTAYQRGINSFLQACGMDLAQLPAGTRVPATWLAGFKGASAQVYYYPSLQDEAGKYVDNTQEVIWLTPDRASEITADPSKAPPRRRRGSTITQSALGTAAAAVTGGVAGRAAVMPPMPGAAATAVVPPPASVAHTHAPPLPAGPVNGRVMPPPPPVR